MRRARPPGPPGARADRPADQARHVRDLDAYCREIEAYLCRKSEGHPARIVGPAFELVRRWARDLVPLKVVCRGIDRYCERCARRHPSGSGRTPSEAGGFRAGEARRRHGIKLEFCAGDVLEAYAEWRRSGEIAGAMPGADSASPDEAPAARPQKASGVVRLRRAIARLTAARAGAASRPREWDRALEAAVRRLDAEAASLLDRSGLRPRAGRAPAGSLERSASKRDDSPGQASPGTDDARDVEAVLAAIERELVETARRLCPASELDTLRRRAALELEPFRSQMPPATYRAALEAAVEKLLRQAFGLPRLTTL